MKSVLLVAGAVAGLSMLAGCAGQELRQAQQVEPTGSAFNRNLYRGYVELSKSEYAEGDYLDSDAFAIRAIQAGAAGAIPPEEIAARSLPDDRVAELTGARTTLLKALERGAGDKEPERAAKAQIMFDCWMQEQEENRQPRDIATCRDGYYAAIDGLEASAPVAVSKAKPQAIRFVVYFDTGKTLLDDAAGKVIAEARAAAAKFGKPLVRISGNADSVGSEMYNQKLSEMRAQAVAKVIGGVATPVRVLVTESYGETRPAVFTADEIDEPRNRRVEIILQP